MTKLLEQAIATARALPPETQDTLARIVLQLVRENEAPALPMSGSEEESFEESLQQAMRGEFVGDKAIEAFWAKHGL